MTGFSRRHGSACSAMHNSGGSGVRGQRQEVTCQPCVHDCEGDKTGVLFRPGNSLQRHTHTFSFTRTFMLQLYETRKKQGFNDAFRILLKLLRWMLTPQSPTTLLETLDETPVCDLHTLKLPYITHLVQSSWYEVNTVTLLF